MNNHDISVREWLDNYYNGKYNIADFKTMVDAGWFDWFCSMKGLLSRLRKLASVVKNVSKDNDFILDNYCFDFKNCCPCYGPLYDMVRFAPIKESGNENLNFTIIVGDTIIGATYAVCMGKRKYIPEFKCNHVRELTPYMHKISAELQAEYSVEAV